MRAAGSYSTGRVNQTALAKERHLIRCGGRFQRFRRGPDGDATALPLSDQRVDVAISNGVLNLVPEKRKAFSEIWRVLRPGGRLQLGDIVLDAPISRAAILPHTPRGG